MLCSRMLLADEETVAAAEGAERVEVERLAWLRDCAAPKRHLRGHADHFGLGSSNELIDVGDGAIEPSGGHKVHVVPPPRVQPCAPSHRAAR